VRATVDFLSPEFLDNPYPAFRELRDNDPVHWHEGLNSWVISRYAECVRVVQDAGTFTSDPRRVGQNLPTAMRNVQSMDGPEHMAIKRLLIDALREIDLRALRGRVEQALSSAVDGKDRLDFVHDVAVPVTAATTLSVLGLPRAAEDDVLEASLTVIRSMMHGLIPDGRQVGQHERQVITDRLDEVYGRTDTGLLGTLSRTATSVDRVELLNSVRVVLLAGINSTQRSLALSLRTLLNRGRWPDSTRALHELTRYEGTAQAASRWCADPVVLGRHRIGRGDTVIALLASANRDEREFPDADRFVPHRQPNPHLGFGRGAHTCPGVSVAHAINSTVFEFLKSRHPHTALDGPATIEPNPALRGLSRLPIRLT
jgi:cytochrome P450